MRCSLFRVNEETCASPIPLHFPRVCCLFCIRCPRGQNCLFDKRPHKSTSLVLARKFEFHDLTGPLHKSNIHPTGAYFKWSIIYLCTHIVLHLAQDLRDLFIGKKKGGFLQILPSNAVVSVFTLRPSTRY